MERPNIPPWSFERKVLDGMNHVFTFVFGVEMFLKVSAILTLHVNYDEVSVTLRQ